MTFHPLQKDFGFISVTKDLRLRIEEVVAVMVEGEAKSTDEGDEYVIEKAKFHMARGRDYWALTSAMTPEAKATFLPDREELA